MAYIADQLFPPINTIEESVEFSNFNYWREPVSDLDLVSFELDDALIAAATTSTSASGTAQTPSVLSKQLPTIPENQKV